MVNKLSKYNAEIDTLQYYITMVSYPFMEIIQLNLGIVRIFEISNIFIELEFIRALYRTHTTPGGSEGSFQKHIPKGTRPLGQ